MRALRVDGSTTSLRAVPMPAAGDEVRVRVTHSGICNTDLELARGYMGFRGTIGHEFVGVVDELGADPTTLRVGQRVVGEINAGCGTCALCATGDSRHCATRTVLGIIARDGAHADYLTLPARNLIPVPDGVRDLDAVFVAPLAAAIARLATSLPTRTGACPVAWSTIAINWPSLPSPITATLSPAASGQRSRTPHAAASGSTNTASRSRPPSGAGIKLRAGNVR